MSPRISPKHNDIRLGNLELPGLERRGVPYFGEPAAANCPRKNAQDGGSDEKFSWFFVDLAHVS